MEKESLKKRTIAVDFDDVLIDFFPAMVEFFNLRENTSYKKEDLRTFYISQFWNWTPDETRKNILDFYEVEKSYDIKNVAGSVEGIKKLKENNDLIVITGRPSHTLDFMKGWLDEYFPDIFKDIYFTNFFFGGEKSKSEICREVGAEVMIDDSISFIEDAAKHGIQALLFNSPWNQGELPQNVTRVHSWNEIVAHLEK